MVNLPVRKTGICHRPKAKVVNFESMLHPLNKLSTAFGVIEEVKRKLCEIGPVKVLGSRSRAVKRRDGINFGRDGHVGESS